MTKRERQYHSSKRRDEYRHILAFSLKPERWIEEDAERRSAFLEEWEKMKMSVGIPAELLGSNIYDFATSCATLGICTTNQTQFPSMPPYKPQGSGAQECDATKLNP